MSYTVIIQQSAQKQITKLPLNFQLKAEKIILALENNPRPSGCKKLKGYNNIYRIRFGTYRIVHSIIDKELVVYIFDVDHRKDIYR